MFADAPHLLKLARNHLLDQGFTIKNKLIDKSCFEMLLSASNTEVTIAYKINKYHLHIKGSERQKVRPAAQLFSNSVSKAIEYCGMKGFMQNSNWKETSKFVKLINDWFDIFNSKCKFGSHPVAKPLGWI